MEQTTIYLAAGFLVFLLLIFFYLRWSAEDTDNEFDKTEELLPDDDDVPDDDYMIIDN